MDKIARAQTFEVSVGGVRFKLRRRSSLVMAEAKGLMAVLGQVSGANGQQAEVSEQKVADMVISVIKAALVEVFNDETGEWLSAWDWYTVDELAPFIDVLFVEFMKSGLALDPTPPSCEA